jgi:hypothetical protein
MCDPQLLMLSPSAPSSSSAASADSALGFDQSRRSPELRHRSSSSPVETGSGRLASGFVDSFHCSSAQGTRLAAHTDFLKN